jgi:hypothetical protein
MTTVLPIVFPTIRYDDVPAAIRFLTKPSGVTLTRSRRIPKGGINHALLRYGSGL